MCRSDWLEQCSMLEQNASPLKPNFGKWHSWEDDAVLPPKKLISCKNAHIIEHATSHKLGLEKAHAS